VSVEQTTATEKWRPTGISPLPLLHNCISDLSPTVSKNTLMTWLLHMVTRTGSHWRGF